MRLGLFLVSVGVGALLVALVLIVSGDPSPLRWVGALIVAWLGWSFHVVGIGYLRHSPSVFAKHPTGTSRRLARVLLAPYLLFTWSIWWLRTTLTKEAPNDEVAPGVWVGRIPRPEDLPSKDTLVIDFTAEFDSHPHVRARRYRAIPTLDGTAPSVDDLKKVLRSADRHRGPVLFHCAFGHGRSAFGAAALLLKRGVYKDVPEALAAMKKVRPGINLSSSQKDKLSQTRWDK